MFIPEKNAIFIFPHYTGFTMMHEALGHYFDDLKSQENQERIRSMVFFKEHSMASMLEKRGRPYPAHPTVRTLHQNLKIPFGSVKWFAAVRNPWSRYWGVYHHFSRPETLEKNIE